MMTPPPYARQERKLLESTDRSGFCFSEQIKELQAALSARDTMLEDMRIELQRLADLITVKELEIDALSQGFTAMNISHIKNSDKKMLKFTSFPADIFNIIHSCIEEYPDLNYYKGWTVRSISRENQLLVTLMKFKLNLQDDVLAHLFDVSAGTISNIIHTFTSVLHEIFHDGILKHVGIPSLLKCKSSMPAAFGESSNARVSVDCTEVEFDIPKSLRMRNLLFSNYKQRHTGKGGVCVAPNATVVWASRLYPGSTSDNALVEHSKLLDYFVEGDVILADKGNTFHKDLPNGVSLNTPVFLRDKDHFTAAESMLNLKIAQSRCHVERANERIKNFRILDHVPKHYRHLSSKIFQTCSVLINFQAPLLKEIGDNYKM